jgi:CPA1 family monovalent cation:H+ antiporter
MLLFELIIALLLVGGLLALFADRTGVPYPSLLALAGALVAFIPGMPSVTLDPELALALFVAPILVDAAYDASPRDLKDNLLPVTSLALICVGLTIIGVAWSARLVVPEIPWAAAIALGAIVAPPDASAATAVLSRLRPPHRVMVILEGESLFNDASALLVYRVAVGVAMTGVFAGWKLLPMLLITCGGGVIAGYVFAKAYLWLTRRIQEIPVSTLLQFIGTFIVWIVSDHIGLSAIITTVAYAMTIARSAPARVGGRNRIASYAVWEVAVFVLNVLAFVLIGLQLRGILSRVEDGQWKTYALCAAAVCAAVFIVRILWVMAHNAFSCWQFHRFGSRSPRQKSRPTAGSGVLISWCGMRGIVTLAAALALPDGEPAQAFPYRDLIILCAFCVVLSTLVIQGLTLKPLMKWLGLKDDGSVDRELAIAREESGRAALKMLSEQPQTKAVEILRREYETRLQAGTTETSFEERSRDESSLAALQRRAVAVQRGALVDLRERDVIGDDAFHAAEEEIDLLDLTADERIRPTPAAATKG